MAGGDLREGVGQVGLRRRGGSLRETIGSPEKIAASPLTLARMVELEVKLP
jgi:hypothetical protein